MDMDYLTPESRFDIDIKKVDYKWNMGNFHSHNSYEIYYLLEGKRTMLVEDRVYELIPGDIVLLSPNVMHRTINSGPHTRINIEFTDKFMSSCFSSSSSLYLLICFDEEFIRLTDGENEQFRKLFAKLSNEHQEKMPIFIELAEILRLFVNAKRRQDKEPLHPKDVFLKNSPKINTIISYISSHYNIISSIDQIANACYINKSYMSRLFKKETGLTGV